MNDFNKVKPKNFRDEMNKLVNELIDNFLFTKPNFEIVSCPFCLKENTNKFFEIKSIKFLRCCFCHSIYTSPRPNKDSFKKFYSMYPKNLTIPMLTEVEKNRKKIIFKRRWKIIQKRLTNHNYNIPFENCIEVGAGIGEFIDIIQSCSVAKNYIVIEPNSDCMPYLQKIKNLQIYNNNLEDLHQNIKGDLIFLNSVIEHPLSLNNFFAHISKMLNDNGVISLFDMNSEGFDVLLLKHLICAIIEHTQKLSTFQ